RVAHRLDQPFRPRRLVRLRRGRKVPIECRLGLARRCAQVFLKRFHAAGNGPEAVARQAFRLRSRRAPFIPWKMSRDAATSARTGAADAAAKQAASRAPATRRSPLRRALRWALRIVIV